MSTPAAFARLLGISSDPGRYRTQAFSSAEYDAIIACYNEVVERDGDKFLSFWLVQSYMIRPFDEDHSLNSLTDLLNYTCWIKLVMDSNSTIEGDRSLRVTV
ncbi:hypothetical protein BDY24DRAFT_415163 [Mrakia frigida]|uniref:uncharacterized protein n=1 Tax=Mrakia frigida TaxID=29902 RepID=UPI003FCBFC89